MLVEEKKQCENSGGLQLEHEAWTLRAPPQILSGDVHGDHLDGGDDGAGGVQDNANLGAGGKGGDDNSCHDNDSVGADDSFLPRRFDWGECLHKAGDFSSGRQGDQKEELCDDAKLTLLSAAKILSSPVDNESSGANAATLSAAHLCLVLVNTTKVQSIQNPDEDSLQN